MAQINATSPINELPKQQLLMFSLLDRFSFTNHMATNKAATVHSRLKADGSGTTAIPFGSRRPVTKLGFTLAPVRVYLPIVPVREFTTNRFVPDISISLGLANPEIKEELTVA